MKFILDENFPRGAIALLKAQGHTGQSVLDFAGKGSDDLEVFKTAQAQKAVLLTTDKDFFYTVPLLFKNHAGVVVIALSQPNRQKILDRLRWALRWLKQGDITARVLLVSDQHHWISGK